MKQTLCRILFLLALLAPAVPVLAQSAEAHTRIADRFYQRMAYALSLIHISEPTRPY
mgnify:CR=1 FL=1